ncbi:MAG: hypothetical protein QM645_11145 [Asticcacaulis sp.]
MRVLFSVFLLFTLTLTISACDNKNIEREFFDKNKTVDARAVAIKDYSIEKQWDIYKYGIDNISPYPVELAEPMSSGGKDLVNHVINDLYGNRNDQRQLAAVLMLGLVQSGKCYDVCSDGSVIGKLKSYKNKIKDDNYAFIYMDSVKRMCIVK